MVVSPGLVLYAITSLRSNGTLGRTLRKLAAHLPKTSVTIVNDAKVI